MPCCLIVSPRNLPPQHQSSYTHYHITLMLFTFITHPCKLKAQRTALSHSLMLKWASIAESFIYHPHSIHSSCTRTDSDMICCSIVCNLTFVADQQNHLQYPYFSCKCKLQQRKKKHWRLDFSCNKLFSNFFFSRLIIKLATYKAMGQVKLGVSARNRNQF